MNTYIRKAKLLALLVVLIISGLAACGGGATARLGTTITQPKPGATTVVTTYLQLFNAGMRGGDFSTMASVFAPNATLTQSNPKGVTAVIHGLTAITSFNQGLRTKFAGYQWTLESMHSLAPNVVLVYQHAGSPPLHVASRCVNLFVVENEKIISYDWATYYPGQQ